MCRWICDHIPTLQSTLDAATLETLTTFTDGVDRDLKSRLLCNTSTAILVADGYGGGLGKLAEYALQLRNGSATAPDEFDWTSVPSVVF